MVEETKGQPQDAPIDKGTSQQIAISDKLQVAASQLLTYRINGINEQKRAIEDYMQSLEKFEQTEQLNFA